MRRYLVAFLSVALLACSTLATPVVLPTATAALPTATVVTPTPPPTPTLTPFEEYTINYLRKRTYGGGKIEILEKLSETDLYAAYSIRYPSDGLHIYGFVTVPKGSGPFPVIVSIHGYAPSGTYNIFEPTYDFADYFAANQFIVFHPGLRNHPPSDRGDNLLRVGMTVDVMNLLALIKARADLPAELASADTNRLGLWGTSMGGEIALRVITIHPDIKATVLYSTLSGNTERNSKQLYEVLQDQDFQLDAQVPLEVLDRISPMYYYYQIKSAVQMHHGTADSTVSISWAAETCNFLESAGVSVQCIYYQGAQHIFNRSNFEKLLRNALEFFQTHLSQ